MTERDRLSIGRPPPARERHKNRRAPLPLFFKARERLKTTFPTLKTEGARNAGRAMRPWPHAQ